MKGTLGDFWSLTAQDVLKALQSEVNGLTSNEAQRRISLYGSNSLKPEKRFATLSLLVGQFNSPIIIILLAATALAFFLHDPVDATIILIIVLASGLLGFWQEYNAANATARLLAIVQITTRTVRDGRIQGIPIEQIVPGDIVLLEAGDIAPGDCLILESKDLYLDEAALTGETFPAEKQSGRVASNASMNKRVNTLFMGTHVISGTAKAVVVRTGRNTEFGKISDQLKLRPAETEFEHGIRRFGYLLMEVTLLLVIVIFVINVYFQRPILEAFLFALALAVGLTPQLLPAIISVNLAHGADRMARKKVVVKRLAAIENFGSMNILCADKTGTLTKGVVHLESAVDVKGVASEKVIFMAFLNSMYQSGFANPIDEAIRASRHFDIGSFRKLDEVPYDFVRKRMTVLAEMDGSSVMVTKGALEQVLQVCNWVEDAGGVVTSLQSGLEQITQRYREFSSNGLRILGVAYKKMGDARTVTHEDESSMTFLGFLVLNDSLKEDIVDTVHGLIDAGVSLKIITGDNSFVALNVGSKIGLPGTRILTGPEINKMSAGALLSLVNRVDIFAQVEPNQKERIVIALKKAGNVVGFMGDGINDAPALHVADVGISVDSAVDVAREAADIVLLERDLDVLAEGILEGRKTFSNTMKYIFMATSANFGNMFSMAGASLIMTFLPMLPKQILLTNLFTDLPEMTISTDNVDKEILKKPRKWDIGFIRNFMIVFGLISSVFDFITFGVLLIILNASPEQLRSGWFIESVVSATLIVLVIRTRRFFLRSRPSKYLVLSTVLVAAAAVILPYTDLGLLFGFAPLPAYFLLIVGVIVIVYAAFAEVAKAIFYRKLVDKPIR
jgi:Mg2+-importing ATPase